VDQRWSEVFAELRKDPGSWYRIKTYSHASTASNAATRVRKRAEEVAGTFDVVVRDADPSNPGVKAIYARCQVQEEAPVREHIQEAQ